jgi:hypothetical protein
VIQTQSWTWNTASNLHQRTMMVFPQYHKPQLAWSTRPADRRDCRWIAQNHGVIKEKHLIKLMVFWEAMFIPLLDTTLLWLYDVNMGSVGAFFPTRSRNQIITTHVCPNFFLYTNMGSWIAKSWQFIFPCRSVSNFTCEYCTISP